MKRVLLVAVSVMVVGGCAAKYSGVDLPRGHPARADAAAAPARPSSGLLTLSDVGEGGQEAGEHGGGAHGDHGAESANAGEWAGERAGERAAERARYTCPMHPAVESAEPGRCPECGMRLVKKAGEP